MSKTPLISVIVPVYNAEAYIRKCVESIIGQTYMNLEIILVDDGSPDNCGKICDEYAKQDNRIVVIHQENTGQAGARNHGIAVAKGEYIGFVDSDDWVAPEMYQVLLDSLQRNGCDIAVCGRFTVRDCAIKESASFRLDEETVMGTQEAVERFVTYNAIDSSSVDKLYKKEIIKDIQFPLGYICEDVPFVYDALAKAKKVVHCAKPLYYVLIRSGSTSRSGFNPKGMGLYYHFRDVSLRCKKDFPQLAVQADYLFLKNLLVLAYRIACVSGNLPQREVVNSEVRKNFKHIIAGKCMKRNYKVLAWAIMLRVERPVMKFAQMLGITLV